MLLLVLASLVSCSTDKEEDLILGGAGSGLLAQVVINYPNNETYTKQYTYVNQNQLDEIIDSNGNRESYEYENGLVSKITYRFQDPRFLDERVFTYDGEGRITEELFLYNFNAVGTKTFFTYETDGSVSFETFSGSLTEQSQPTAQGVYSLAPDGKILAKTETNLISGIESRFEYGYDTNKGAYTNIADGSKDFLFVLGAKNNITRFSMNVGGTEVYRATSSFDYNSADLPEAERKTDTAGTANISYTYL